MSAADNELLPFAAAARLVVLDAQTLSDRTSDRLALRGPQGRELSAESRKALTDAADAMEDAARDLRALAQPRAALTQYIRRVQEALTNDLPIPR